MYKAGYNVMKSPNRKKMNLLKGKMHYLSLELGIRGQHAKHFLID